MAIVRQLMENFIDAAGQARGLLDRAGHDPRVQAEAGLSSQQLPWTREGFSRLYDAPGTLDSHRGNDSLSPVHNLSILLGGRSSWKSLDQGGSWCEKRARAQPLAPAVRYMVGVVDA